MTANEQQLLRQFHEYIMERQRLLIREANFLRSLVDLPPVKGSGAPKAPGKDTEDGGAPSSSDSSSDAVD